MLVRVVEEGGAGAGSGVFLGGDGFDSESSCFLVLSTPES